VNDLIFGQGYDQADLMIIGDYARKFDQQSGYCLSGYYKSKIGEYLKVNEYNVDQTYRTCIIKNYVKGLGVGTWKSDKKILESCFEVFELQPQSFYIDNLIDEINTIKPLVIVAMGEYALRTLTGKEGISKWRGSTLPLVDDISARINLSWIPKVVATQHPSIVHTQEEEQFILHLDFKKAVELLYSPNKAINDHEINIARSSMDVLRFNEMYPYDKFPDMTYDIESHHGFITCAGYSFDGYRGLTIPLWGMPNVDPTDMARMLYILSTLLAERNICNQNLGFDKRVSRRFGLYPEKCVWDTMLAQNIIECEFPKNLGFLTSIYTNMSYYKDEGHDFDPRHGYDRLMAYNCKDAISTFQIWRRQIEDLKELEQYEFFTEFVMRLFNLYYDLDSVGILADLNKRDELARKYEAIRDLKYMEICAITTPDRLNLNSPTQIGKYLEAQGFPVLRHRVESGFMVVNTDVQSLKKMLIADPLEYRKCGLPYEMALRFLRLVLLIRRIDTILEYIGIGIHPWGRFHTSSKIAGTTSGRTSGGQTAEQYPTYIQDKGKVKLKYKNLGHSFQTITKHGFIIEGEEDTDIEEGVIGKDIRDMFIPDPDYVLIEADGAQAEARVCDVLGEDWDSLEEYKKFDKHCKVAAMIASDPKVFGQVYTYEDIFRLAKKEHTDLGVFMRQIGKHSKHAKNNGMDYYHFAQMYIHLPDFKQSLILAKNILAQIDRVYPNIEGVFHKQVEEAIRSTRTLVSPRAYGTPAGRKRRFFKKIDKHYLNVAFAQLPQSAISDHTKAAALRIMDRVDKSKAHLIAENHDSLTALVHRRYIRPYCNIAKVELERPIDFRACTLARDYELIIPAEFSIGRKRWGQMKEIKKFRLTA
jgi:uracil-DNA glycosylase